MESEIIKIRAEKLTLQKTLNKEREEKQKLIERVEELEALCKRKTEEIEALQLFNHQLVHKCESLQEKINSKSAGWVSGWWHSNQKKVDPVKILEEELQNKIAENEQVHIKNFEIRQKYHKKIEDYKEKVKSSNEVIRNSAEKIEALAIEVSQYQNTIYTLVRENKELLNLVDSKNKEIQDSHNYFAKISNENKQKISYLQVKLKSVISLDLSDYENFSTQNAPKFNKNFQFKQNEWLNKIWQTLGNSSGKIKIFLQKYCLRLECIYSNSKVTHKRIVREVIASSEKLLAAYDEFLASITENRSNLSEIMRILGIVDSNFSYFSRLIRLAISKEEEIVQDYDKFSKFNTDLSNGLSKIGILISRGIALITCSAYSKKNVWVRVQEIAKSLSLSIQEFEKYLKDRLSLDKTLKYKTSPKDIVSINDEMFSEFQKISAFFNQLASEVMQLRPPFYYSLNPLYQSTSNYLSNLRKINSAPGIPYNDSLENVKFLSLNQQQIKEQSQAIQALDKKNSSLLKEIDNYKAEVLKFENELAAVEQNLERKIIETGKGLLHEHEDINEDVKNGAQRFALRLTDNNGEAIPISTISVNNDIYLKIQEIAINKINELAEKANLNRLRD